MEIADKYMHMKITVLQSRTFQKSLFANIIYASMQQKKAKQTELNLHLQGYKNNTSRQKYLTGALIRKCQNIRIFIFI